MLFSALACPARDSGSNETRERVLMERLAKPAKKDRTELATSIGSKALSIQTKQARIEIVNGAELGIEAQGM